MTEVGAYDILTLEVVKMIAKMTVKNQLTIPKKVLERAGFSMVRLEERYFDVEAKDNVILLKPVTVTVEERIPDKQWEKFENWASKTQEGDIPAETAEKSSEFLKKRLKRK